VLPDEIVKLHWTLESRRI